MLPSRGLALLVTLAACAPGLETTDVTIVNLEETMVRLFPKDNGPRSPMIVNFWATWCPPCVAELPDLIAATSLPETMDIRLMTVSFDLMIPGITAKEAENKVHRHLQNHSQQISVLIFDEDNYSGINQALNLPGPIPVTLAFDRNGKEVGRIQGPASQKDFQNLAAWALGKDQLESP